MRRLPDWNIWEPLSDKMRSEGTPGSGEGKQV